VEQTRPNRLINEKSPYLLQHAHNPVDWYPWGDEAFEKARREGKIVFLSIGYATCHWCHVMERESFEDPEVAGVLNEVSVPIKVDREERPDLDQVYMTVCQMLTKGGGWPLNILLTPDRVPFFAGTYFPKETRPGRIGLVDLLRQASALWKKDPERVVRSGNEILQHLRSAAGEGEPGEPSERLFDSAAELLARSFDPARGGFGRAPKFPTPHNLTYLVRRHRRTGNADLIRMVETSLDAMGRGGIYDHVGFGFHRYSTDAEWLLPHFEKMLYDQAGLAMAYLETYQATRNIRHARTAREIFGYILRDMTGPEGGFFSAEDADSEGVEGKFYVWTRAEIFDVLGREEGEFYGRIYGVKEEGNFRDEASGARTGANILHLDRPLEAWGWELGMPPGELESRIEADRRKLFERRKTRVHPLKDDKVITAWNGLMISALARGAWVLEEPGYAEAAARSADFIHAKMRPGGRLLRRYRDGEAAIPAFAEDYAFLARGLLDLHQATLEPERLSQALELARELVRLFWDDTGEGVFDTGSDAETLVVRPKEPYDGATPSANSAALDLFARLGLLLGEPRWTERARAIAGAFAGRLERYAAGFTQFLQGAALLLEPTREVVVAGDPESADTRALLDVLRSAYAPETSVLLRGPGLEGEHLAEMAPFTRDMIPGPGGAAAYVCHNYACAAPTSDPEELRRILAAGS
jgi:uncharacterized protein YyaL (SSP411 family)